MPSEFSSSLEEVPGRPTRADLSILALSEAPRAQHGNRPDVSLAGQIFYFLFGGVLPLAGVLWVMASYP
jgi:hypothetical protein